MDTLIKVKKRTDLYGLRQADTDQLVYCIKDNIIYHLRDKSRIAHSDGWEATTSVSQTAFLPTATATSLGGIKVGSGLQIVAGVLSVVGGGGSMVYPAAGIAVSTGSAWGTSITNNSANWNTAYGWGNHAGLYAAISHNQPESSITFTDITTGNASDSTHGYLPKLAMVAGQYLRSDGTWQTPPDTNTTYSVITTDEIDDGIAATPKTISGARAKYIIDKSVPIAHLTDFNHSHIANGQIAYGWGNHAGLYSALGHTHAESTITFSDITTGNASDTMHGYLPKLSMVAGQFLRADGTWQTPTGTSYTVISTAEIDAGTSTADRIITAQRVKYIIDKSTPVSHLTDFNHGNFISTGDSRLTDARPASDVYAWAKASVKPTYSYTEVGAAAASHNQAESTITFTDITTGNANEYNHGYLPKLSMTAGQFLRADGTWQTPAGTSYTELSESEIDAGVSSTLRAISGRRAGYIISKSTPASHLTDFNHSTFVVTSDSRLSDARPASDVYSWAKAATKPSYTYSEVGAVSTSDSRLSDARPASDVYAWAKAATKPSYTPAEIGAAESGHTHSGYENHLGYPALNGYVLSSTTGGTRSWIEMTSGGSLSYYNNTLGSAVSIGTANTWYNALARTLTAGTWLVIAHINLLRSTTTAVTYTARISNGSTTYYASGSAYNPSTANNSITITLTAIITLASSTTIYLQGTANQGATINATAPYNGSGANATQMQCIKIG